VVASFLSVLCIVNICSLHFKVCTLSWRHDSFLLVDWLCYLTHYCGTVFLYYLVLYPSTYHPTSYVLPVSVPSITRLAIVVFEFVMPDSTHVHHQHPLGILMLSRSLLNAQSTAYPNLGCHGLLLTHILATTNGFAT